MKLVRALTIGLCAAVCLAASEPNEKGKEEKDKGLPLKPERKIEFTTDEGTWLSLDVSPDGKTIVFELLGNLYTLPIEGGDAKRITPQGLAFNSQPRYSPDGSRIAFISDRDGSDNLWISKPDGSDAKKVTKETQLLNLVSPSWTPDGEYVLLARQGDTVPNGLWIYNVKGGAGVQITGAKSAPAPGSPPQPEADVVLGAVASRDGRYLYYAKSVRGASGLGFFPFWQVARRDRVTGDQNLLTKAPGSAIRPMLSPDGTKLVYGTRYDAKTALRVLDLSTGEERWLKYPIQRDDQESYGSSRDLLPGYAFTPDGKDLVISYGGKIHRLDVATGADRIIPFNAHVTQELGPKLDFPRRVEDGPTLRARLIQDAVESPDGKRLAFSALTHVYVMDLPAGTPRRVTKGDTREFQPAWSPDGKWLAYVSWSTDGGQIWKVRVDGRSEPQRLTHVPVYYTQPCWSPDGSRIVALRAPRQIFLSADIYFLWSGLDLLDLVWVPAGGGNVTTIAPALGFGSPHFSRGGDRIYVHSGRDNASGRELVSVRWDGTDKRTHLKIAPGKNPRGVDWTPKDAVMSPDGTMALFLFHTQLYLVAVPQFGGEPPTVSVDGSGLPLKKLTDVGADYFAWADGSSTITWGLGSRFFRQRVSTISFEPEKKKDDEGKDKSEEKKEKPPEVRKQEKPPVEVISIAIEAPRSRPKGVIALRGARVITMKGDEVIDNADVVVTANRITAVGPRDKVAIPAEAKVIDVSGATIMPGMIDTHAHWNDFGRGLLDMQNWDFLANLAYGVTTGRDPQTSSNDIFAYQDLVDAGVIPGPRAYSTGPGVFDTADLQSAEDAVNIVSKYADYYRTHMIKSYMVGTRKQREWIVAACKELKVMPTTEGASDLMLDSTHAIDGFSGNEHALPIVPLYKDVVQLFAQSGISETPTLLVTYGGPMGEDYFFERYDILDDSKLRRFFPHSILEAKGRRRMWFREDEYHFGQVAASAAKIAEAGGRICLGGHGELQGLQDHWELWALQSGGMSNLEALRSATLHGAEAIGYAQDLGSIEVGKLADLIVLAKDPLKDIHNSTSIRYVMKNGELFEGDTLDEVWPERKPLAPLWFWNDKP